MICYGLVYCPFVDYHAAMEIVLDSFSEREIASAVWLGAIILFVALYKPTRGSFLNVLRAFFKPILLVPLAIAALYATAEIWLLRLVGWWSIANLKTTILWLVTFAFVTMFEFGTARNRKTGFGKLLRDILSITGVLLFVAELYSFSLPVELIALPIVTFIALTSEVAKVKPEHASVAKLLGCTTGAIGFSYPGFSLWKTIAASRETATWANALEFLIPILLSLGFLPFLYGWRIYVAYSEVFSTISIFGFDQRLVPYARWLAVTRIRSDLDLLERWRRVIQASRPSDKAVLKHSLVALLALRSWEASPTVVSPKDGWSPYLAMRFMADLGIQTGYYHRSFDRDWFASSPLCEIGDSRVFPNNLAYYVDGSEHAATTLKIELNVNDPTNAAEAEDLFVLHAMHLLEQAVSLDAVERLKSQIATLRPFDDEIPFGTVALSREEFTGGIKDGSSRTFEVRRAHPAP